MTIDQLQGANELIDDAQDYADMVHVTSVVAPRLMAEVWSLRGILVSVYASQKPCPASGHWAYCEYTDENIRTCNHPETPLLLRIKEALQ